MVILRSKNKITDFLMILAWASPFKYYETDDMGLIFSAGLSIYVTSKNN